MPQRIQVPVTGITTTSAYDEGSCFVSIPKVPSCILACSVGTLSPKKRDVQFE
jgi:hypothetical protein